jgi:hypothetical protein
MKMDAYLVSLKYASSVATPSYVYSYPGQPAGDSYINT